MKALLALLIASVSGCALEPNSIRPEIEHVSHAFQHEPFTSHPTNYGYTQLSLVAHWEVRHAYVELGEGYNLDSADGNACGALYGGHEVFTARAGYIFNLKP